ncbi:hypothetical protein T484DRAFT_3218743 [Baffinella frigidus]|nr:hypothetical protein T484DRAFT_3218743 [Cryptophyta sp. CCMP2293]
MNHEPSTLNPQPSTLNPQPSTLNPQPSTLNPQPSTLNPQTQTLNPQTRRFWQSWVRKGGNARCPTRGYVNGCSLCLKAMQWSGRY